MVRLTRTHIVPVPIYVLHFNKHLELSFLCVLNIRVVCVKYLYMYNVLL
jgi:hypothetical protein